MADFLGELLVSIKVNTDQLDSGLSNVNKKLLKTSKNLKAFGEKAKTVGQNLTTGLTLPLLAAGAASVKFAIDAEETNAKFLTAFRGIEDQANSTAKALASGYGLATLEAEKLLSGTGDLLKGFGATAGEALEFA